MSKSTFTFTHADGRVEKRNSERGYTHVILGTPKEEWCGDTTKEKVLQWCMSVGNANRAVDSWKVNFTNIRVAAVDNKAPQSA